MRLNLRAWMHNSKMDHCSYFIRNRALFGNYPTQEGVYELERAGVRYFINLTLDGEKRIRPYRVSSSSKVIRFPIKDHSVPKCWNTFSRFIIRLGNIIGSIPNGHLLFVHCRGGHGRAALVVAALLAYIFKVTPEAALQWTARFHAKRPAMREKWRAIGAPHQCKQRSFVFRLFEPLKMYRMSYSSSRFGHGFSRQSKHPFSVDTGDEKSAVFSCIDTALVYKKFPAFKKECVKCKTEDVNTLLKKVKRLPSPNGWTNKRENVLIELFKMKMKAYPYIRSQLANTGFRDIQLLAKGNSKWIDGTGDNVTGNVLMIIREEIHSTPVLNAV